MHNFNEEFLQFIWQYKLLKPLPFITHSGLEIKVVKPGELNTDAGPDFFDASIKVNDLILVGNIEVHIKTSDWLKHGHQHDRSYDNIILHVVYEHDVELEQNRLHQVEILEVKHLIDEKIIATYNGLHLAKDKLACSAQLKYADDFKFVSWLERMTVERLEEKTHRIEQLLKAFNGDYSQTFYTLLLRNFGFKVNAVPFELLAKHLPYTILLRHADNLLHLEALLLGMSGLLDDQVADKYVQTLQNEFEYLKSKYGLIPLQKNLFKFSKLRPANFPNVRLSQLAALIHNSPGVLSNPQQLESFDEVMAALQIKSSRRQLSLGEDSCEIIIINTFVPFFFFYSKKLLKPELGERALEWLRRANFENNFKTRLFHDKKTVLKTASDSQGIINLYDNYCTKKRCLQCGIALSLLKPADKSPGLVADGAV